MDVEGDFFAAVILTKMFELGVFANIWMNQLGVM